MPPLAPATPEEILLPARPWFVLITIVGSFLIGLIPVEGLARTLRPDLVALAIVYWCVHEPRLLGVGTAWLLGLAVDVADATLLGQHALAYAVLAFAAGFLRRRLRRFTLTQQASHVALLLALTLGLTWVVRRVGGAPPVGAAYFVPVLTGAVIWLPFAVLLQWPQRPTSGSEF